MSAFVRLLFVICTCAVTPAFAGGPAPAEPEQSATQSSAPAAPNAATQPATAAPSAADSTVSNAATTPATSANTSTTQSPNPATAGKVVLVDKTMTDAQVKQILAKGYRPQTKGGEVLYCRREEVLGSRFEQKICKSGEQIMRDELDAQEEAARSQRSTGNNPMGH